MFLLLHYIVFFIPAGYFKHYQKIIFVFMWPCVCPHMCINIAIIKTNIIIANKTLPREYISYVLADWCM